MNNDNTDGLMFGMGALPSPADARDWHLGAVGAPTTYPASRFIDMSFREASMQGQIGCCVGCTGEEVVRRIVYLMTGSTEELSFRFVYAMAKCLEGTIQKNADGTTSDYRQFSRTTGANDGTFPALVAQVIRKYGVCLAKFCPNDVNLSADDFCYGRNINNIPAAALADALTRKSGHDFAVPITEDGIKQAINYAADNKGGVMILRRVGDTYWKKNGVSTWRKDQLLPIGLPASFTSGHEEFLTGYDYEPVTGRMRIYWLNHWSPAWCSEMGILGVSKDGGYGWEYFDVWVNAIVEIRVSVYDVPVVQSFKYHFTNTLKFGDQGADVVALQHVLKLENLFDYPTFTGNFKDLTKAGVIALQEKYASEILTPAGLTKGTGNVGIYTLAWLNKHYGTAN
jgi:hypothetical protein